MCPPMKTNPPIMQPRVTSSPRATVTTSLLVQVECVSLPNLHEADCGSFKEKSKFAVLRRRCSQMYRPFRQVPLKAS
jgi:hypothetical protein